MKSEDFEKRVRFTEFGLQGPEPSIRRLVFEYYSKHFSNEQAQEYTERYIAQMCKETS